MSMRNPALAFALTLLAACPATEDQVKDTLTALGFTDIERTQPAIWECSKEEIGSHFTARNPAGAPISGVVCCGWVYKACTVRGLSMRGTDAPN